MQQDQYLSRVALRAEQALVQLEAVTRCERHKDVLLYNANPEAERRAALYATHWLKLHDGITFCMPEDLRDAIASVLARAAKDGCPECAREGKP